MRRSISRMLSRYSLTRPRSRDAQHLLKVRRLLGNRVEQALLLLRAHRAIGRRAGLAEQPLEHHARVDFHRQRSRRRAPRNRVEVGAAEPGRARADIPGEVLGRHFERRKRGLLADLLRHDLIDRRVRQHVLGFGPLRPHAGQVAAHADRVIADLAAGMRPRQVLHDDERVLERLERLQDRGELEAVAGFLREELVDDRPVGDVDRAEAQARRRARGLEPRQRRQRRHHRVEKRQRDRRAHAAQERSPWKRQPGYVHIEAPNSRLPAAEPRAS